MPTLEEQAAAVRRAGEAEREGIWRDATLDAVDRARQLRLSRESEQQSLSSLRRQAQAGDVDRRNAVLQRLSSPPTSDVETMENYRSALDRATGTRVATGDLGKLLDQAARTGDELQQRAAFAVGLERGDGRVIRSYAASHPDVVPDLEELDDLTPNTRDRMISAAAFRAGR